MQLEVGYVSLYLPFLLQAKCVFQNVSYVHTIGIIGIY